MNAKNILTNWVASFYLSISQSFNPNEPTVQLAYTASPQAISHANLIRRLAHLLPTHRAAAFLLIRQPVFQHWLDCAG